MWGICNMKLNRTLLSMAFSLVLLTGCAEAPSEVKEEINEYNHAQAAQDARTSFLPVSKAIQDAYKFLDQNKTNITIQNLILPESDNIPLYNISFNNSETEDVFSKLQSEPLFANDGNGTTVNTPNDLDVWKTNKDYCFTAFPELDGINYYRNREDIKQSDWGIYYGQNMRTTDLGGITLYSDEQNTGIGSALQYPVEKRYLTDFLQNTESYILCDGSEMSVADATQFSQDFCNNYLSIIENSLFDYQVNYVDVRQVSPEQYGYYISLCRKDLHGNLFDATPIYTYTLDEFENRNPLIASPIHLWITSTDNIAEFEIIQALTISEIIANDQIVSLGSAVNILSNELAQGKSYDFETVELKYILETTSSDYIDAARNYAKSSEYDSNTYGIVYSPDSIFAYGNYQITAIPYWVFTDITAQNTDTNCGGIFMINAIDGNLRIENIDGNGNQIIHY